MEGEGVAWKSMIAQAGRCGWQIDPDTGKLLDEDSAYDEQSKRKREVFRKRIGFLAKGLMVNKDSKSSEPDTEPRRKKKRVEVEAEVESVKPVGEEKDEDDIDDDETDVSIVVPGSIRPAEQFIALREPTEIVPFVFSDRNTAEEFTAENCLAAVELGLSEWCTGTNPLATACRKFNIPWDGETYPIPEHALNQAVIENAYRREFCAFAEILYRSNQAGIYRDEEFKEKIIRVQRAIYYSCQTLMNLNNVVVSYTPHSGLPNDPTIFRFRPFSQDDISEYHEAIIFCTAKIQELKYVRYQSEHFYKRIYNEHNQFVHAYEKAESIETFVYSVASMYSNFDIWKTISDRKNADMLIKYLSRAITPEIPVLKKDRYVMSFKNGLYFIKEDRFIEHGSTAIPPNVIACKYHALEFKYTTLTEVDFQGDEEDNGPRHQGTVDEIPTPSFDKILVDQDMSYTTRVWFYVLYGRLMYWTRDVENWQVWAFCHGLAGTGKSTLCELIAQFYDKDDTGVLPNRIETTFGLWALFEKLVIYAPEVNTDFGIDRTDLQSMITGEGVQIKEKLGKAHAVDWRAPGMMAGNEIPNWNDKQGAMVRRLVIFKYINKISKSDSNLIQKLKKELPAIILKCNKFFLAALKHVGQASIWEKLPKYFHDSRAVFQGEVSPIHGFLNSDDVRIVFGADGKPDESVYIPLSTLRDKYKEWKQNNDIRLQGDRWNADIYTKAFSDIGLGAVARKKLPYPRDSIVSTMQRVVYGLDTTQEIDRLTSFNI